MKPRMFDQSWYAKVMKRTDGLVLACGPTGAGVRLWTRRLMLGHRDDEVLADQASAALRIPVPTVGPDDDPVVKAAEAKDAAVKERLAEIRKFAAGAPVVLNWTTRDLGTAAARFDVENLGLPGALIDGVNAVLYIMRDGRLTSYIDKCWILKDDYSAEPRSKMGP